MPAPRNTTKRRFKRAPKLQHIRNNQAQHVPTNVFSQPKHRTRRACSIHPTQGGDKGVAGGMLEPRWRQITHIVSRGQILRSLLCRRTLPEHTSPYAGAIQREKPCGHRPPLQRSSPVGRQSCGARDPVTTACRRARSTSEPIQVRNRDCSKREPTRAYSRLRQSACI